jgi:beta-xylosidase
MQYAAPGTEFNVYGDGVYMSDSALGPYHYAPNNPVFYKPGGFMNGAGHGSTVTGPDNKYWHFASMALSVNVNWERRIVCSLLILMGWPHYSNPFGIIAFYTLLLVR